MSRVALLVRKDLRVLRRSPLLLGALVFYPLMIALLIALVAAYGEAKPRVALVDEDGLPDVVEIAGQRFNVNRTIGRVSEDVDLVRLSRADAEDELSRGRLVGVLTVPPGFVASLKTLATSPTLTLETTRGPLSAQVTQQAQALVYSLNRQLQDVYIEANLDYVNALERGGSIEFAGQKLDILGLAGVEEALAGLPPTPQVEEVRRFVDTGAQALDFADEAIRATANPIELQIEGGERRVSATVARLEAHALALSLAFLALVLAAASLAAERDENVVGRLTRGLVTRTELLASKLVLASLLATLLALAVAISFAAAVEGSGETSAPWARLPLLAVGLVLASATLAAAGALLAVLAREARVATLAAVLVVLPVVFLSLVPREVAPPAGYASDLLPFTHAVRLLDALLFAASPVAVGIREAAWLLALGLAFAALARAGMRRLLT